VPNISPPPPRPASDFFQPGSAYTPPNRDAAPPDDRGPAPPTRPSRAPPTALDEPDLAPRSGGNVGMIVLIAIAALGVLGGGGFFVWNTMQARQANATWTEVDKTNADAVRRYMSANPNSHHDEAQRALDSLEADSFAAAQRSDTIPAYEGFLREYPQSTHMLEARGRIAELRNQQAAAQAATLTSTSTDTTTATTSPDLLPPGASGATATTEPSSPTTGGPVQLTPAPSTTTTQQ